MRRLVLASALAACAAWPWPATAQTSPAGQPQPPVAKSPATPTSGAAPILPVGIQPPPDYIIGNDDVLNVVFWREKDMSSEVSVRPDGKISLPLINDVQAAGLTPDQLRVNLMEAAGKFVEDTTVSVVVKSINSLRVYITGQVGKPGAYPLMSSTTVLQLIAMAGGVSEYSDSKKIQIIRVENGKPTSHKFNYQDFVKGKNIAQNIALKPGDTIIVP